MKESDEMNKILKILLILFLIGTASAAVYVTTNPEAVLWFSRDSPGPDVEPVTTLILVDGVWSNSIDIGKMDSEYLTLQVKHENTNADSVYGIIMFDIECVEGLVSNPDGSIKDFHGLKYMHPDGTNYQCNNASNISKPDSTKIIVTPTLNSYEFQPGVDVMGGIELNFIDYAHGNYKLTIYVEEEV